MGDYDGCDSLVASGELDDRLDARLVQVVEPVPLFSCSFAIGVQHAADLQDDPEPPADVVVIESPLKGDVVCVRQELRRQALGDPAVDLRAGRCARDREQHDGSLHQGRHVLVEPVADGRLVEHDRAAEEHEVVRRGVRVRVVDGEGRETGCLADPHRILSGAPVAPREEDGSVHLRSSRSFDWVRRRGRASPSPSCRGMRS